MKFYFDKAPITPHIPVLQQGFAARNKKSEGVHDDPYVSVVVITKVNTIVIIQMDVVYGDRSFAFGIKEAIYDEFKIPEENIIINYSHTHSVVGVTGEDPHRRRERPYSMAADKFLWDYDKYEVDYTEDILYYKDIRKKIIDIIKKGLVNQVEGSAYIKKGFSKFGVSRRYPNDDGTVSWKPYYNIEAIDPDLYIIKFVDSDNNLKGLLYNYACHPTTLGSDNYLISADYPGVVRRILEEEYKGSTVIFLQGCGADAKPYITDKNGVFASCNFDELEEAGVKFAYEISNLIKEDGYRKICDEGDFLTDKSDVWLYSEKWDVSMWESIANDEKQSPYRRDSAKKVVSLIKEGKINDFLPYYISFIRFDGKTAITALEGEVVSGIGKLIKSVFPLEDCIVLGYSNSSSCYIPTKEVLKQGGYERDSFIGARLSGPFVPEVEDIIIGRCSIMISKKK